MKKAIRIGVLLFGVMFSMNLFAQGTKIAVINPDKVLRESISGKKAIGELQKIRNQKQGVLQKKQNELKALQDKLETQKFTLSEEARLKLAKKIDDKKVEIQRYAKDADLEIQMKMKKLFDKIQKEIQPIIEKIRVEKGIDLILDIRAGIISMNPQIDITDLVIERYNRYTLSKPKGKKGGK